MCEIRLTKLSCAAQQVGIVHFYAVTEIKGLSCRLWWMRERRNLLTSTHVGYRSVIRAVASGAPLKFGVQGASATNWFSRVNGARDNGIRLYKEVSGLQQDLPRQHRDSSRTAVHLYLNPHHPGRPDLAPSPTASVQVTCHSQGRRTRMRRHQGSKPSMWAHGLWARLVPQTCWKNWLWISKA